MDIMLGVIAVGIFKKKVVVPNLSFSNLSTAT